jgi:hypothetical protein
MYTIENGIIFNNTVSSRGSAIKYGLNPELLIKIEEIETNI